MYDCFTEDGQGAHSFMFNWDGSCAWMYVDSGSNWIKLGPCGNDLSAKQDVNQYLTETRVFSHAVPAGAPYQQEAFENLDVSKAGYRAVALSGYGMTFSGTVGSISVQDVYIDVASQKAHAHGYINATGGGDMTLTLWITYAQIKKKKNV